MIFKLPRVVTVLTSMAHFRTEYDPKITLNHEQDDQQIQEIFALGFCFNLL